MRVIVPAHQDISQHLANLNTYADNPLATKVRDTRDNASLAICHQEYPCTMDIRPCINQLPESHKHTPTVPAHLI